MEKVLFGHVNGKMVPLMKIKGIFGSINGKLMEIINSPINGKQSI